MADYAAAHPAPGKGASMEDLQEHILATRRDLAETLDAVEDKFDVPAHTARLAAAVRTRIRENPLPVAAVGAALVTGTVLVVGAVVAIVRR